VFVSTAGVDLDPGTLAKPFRTIQKCVTAAPTGASCVIRGGTYPETITPNSGITVMPYDKEKVVLDGTVPVPKAWVPYRDGIYQLDVELRGDGTDQLFLGDMVLTEARWPNGNNLFNPTWGTGAPGTAMTSSLNGSLVNSSLPTSADPKATWAGARIYWMSGDGPWAPITGLISSVPNSSTLAFTLDSPIFSYTNRYSPMLPRPGGLFFITGSMMALDDVHEWFYDSAAKKLYFKTPAGINPNTLDIRRKSRDIGINLNGKSNVTIRGLRLFATTLTSDASSTNIMVDGINAKYPSHYTRIKDIGGGNWQNRVADTGIILNGTAHTIKNSEISHSAGNGVVLLGSGHRAENNLIHHFNYMGDYTSAVGAKGTGHQILNNTIHTAARGGIYFGLHRAAGVTYNNDGVRISRNNIYNVMLFSKDGAAIYTGATTVSNTSISNNWIHAVKSSIPKPQPSAQHQSPVSGVYIDYSGTGYRVEQNMFWNIDAYSVNLNWEASRAKTSNDNKVLYNSILDLSLHHRIKATVMRMCTNGQIIGNRTKDAPEQTDYGSNNSSWFCTLAASDNTATSRGADQMESSVNAYGGTSGGIRVGCNFDGCETALPPKWQSNGAAVSLGASIAKHPFDTITAAGSTVTLSVTGAGTGTLTYQWKRNGQPIAGATQSTFTTPALGKLDSGVGYSVEVTNALGSATSRKATVTVY
jgi:hypothetical protein